MQIISAREFRSNQSRFLRSAKNGESVILTSREGNFKIIPITEEDSLSSRLYTGLKEVKLIQEGKIKPISLKELLDEL